MNINTLLALIVIAALLMLTNKFVTNLVERVAEERNISEDRTSYVLRSIQLVLLFLCGVAAIALTGSNIRDVGMLIGSSLAFIGVALFAQWSLLSNATASVIVFFFFPYKPGDRVEIIDGDNTVVGKIKEISLFHVILRDESKAIVTYPNSLVFQKAVRITTEKPLLPEEEGMEYRHE